MEYFSNKIGVEYLSPQLRGFLQRGYLLYDDMKNHLKYYPSYSDAEKKEHGGLPFYNWVKSALTKKREWIESQKNFKDKIGMHNTYNKAHERDLGNAHTQRSVYESVKTIYITENQLKQIKKCQVVLN